MSSYRDLIVGKKYEVEYDILKAACGVYMGTEAESGDTYMLEVTGPSYGEVTVLGKKKKCASFTLSVYALDKEALASSMKCWYLTGHVENALTLVEQELKAIDNEDDAITMVSEDIVQGLSNLRLLRIVELEKLSKNDEIMFASQIITDDDYEDDECDDDDFDEDDE